MNPEDQDMQDEDDVEEEEEDEDGEHEVDANPDIHPGLDPEEMTQMLCALTVELASLNLTEQEERLIVLDQEAGAHLFPGELMFLMMMRGSPRDLQILALQERYQKLRKIMEKKNPLPKLGGWGCDDDNNSVASDATDDEANESLWAKNAAIAAACPREFASATMLFLRKERVLETVLSFLPFKDVSALLKVHMSSFFVRNETFNAIYTRDLARLLESKNIIMETLFDGCDPGELVIAGSTTVQALLSIRWPDSDVDIYTLWEHAPKARANFRKMGYRFVERKTDSDFSSCTTRMKVETWVYDPALAAEIKGAAINKITKGAVSLILASTGRGDLDFDPVLQIKSIRAMKLPPPPPPVEEGEPPPKQQGRKYCIEFTDGQKTIVAVVLSSSTDPERPFADPELCAKAVVRLSKFKVVQPPKMTGKMMMMLAIQLEVIQDVDKRMTVQTDDEGAQNCCGHCQTADPTLRCARCKTVKYCDAACQKAHWPTHKPECTPPSLYDSMMKSRGVPKPESKEHCIDLVIGFKSHFADAMAIIDEFDLDICKTTFDGVALGWMRDATQVTSPLLGSSRSIQLERMSAPRLKRLEKYRQRGITVVPQSSVPRSMDGKFNQLAAIMQAQLAAGRQTVFNQFESDGFDFDEF